MKILFEAVSIIPTKSGGIENYLYMLVNAWKKTYPEDQIFLHIAPGLETKYRKEVGDADYLTDSVYKHTQKIAQKTCLLNQLLSLLVRIFPKLNRYFFGLRKSWVRKLDSKVDVVIYPFQRELFVHEPGKVIFVMHDFRMIDLPGGNPITIENQKKAIEKSAFVISSWPYPFRRLTQEFPCISSKFYQIPFLYDPMNLVIENKVKGDFLYYPAGMVHHKNHKNLISALYFYNSQTKDKLSLVCTGPENTKIKQELSLLVDELKLKDYVFFKGFVDREEVFRLYNECLAVITPTFYEAVSGPILEAFRFEKPVIASNIPAHSEFLKEYGLTIETFNAELPEQMAASIYKVVHNYNYHVELSLKGKRNLSFITPEFTVEKFHDLAVKVTDSFKI